MELGSLLPKYASECRHGATALLADSKARVHVPLTGGTFCFPALLLCYESSIVVQVGCGVKFFILFSYLESFLPNYVSN